MSETLPLFLCFQPDEVMAMHDALMKHGAFSWNELMTTDVDAARSFYDALFGWSPARWRPVSITVS